MMTFLYKGREFGAQGMEFDSKSREFQTQTPYPLQVHKTR